MTHTEPRSSVSSLPEHCRNRPPRSWFVTRHGCHFVKQRLCLATQTTIELVRTERPATPKSPERHLDDPAQIEPGGRTLLDVNEDTRSLAFAHHAHDVVSGSELFPSIGLSRSNASAPTAVFKLAVVFSRSVQQRSAVACRGMHQGSRSFAVGQFACDACSPVEQVAAAAVPRTRRRVPKRGTSYRMPFNINCIAITA